MSPSTVSPWRARLRGVPLLSCLSSCRRPGSRWAARLTSCWLRPPRPSRDDVASVLIPRRPVGRSFAARRGPVSFAKMGLDSLVLPVCPAFGLALSPPAALDAPSRPSLLSCDSARRLFALGASFPPPRSIRRPSRTIVSSGFSAGPSSAVLAARLRLLASFVQASPPRDDACSSSRCLSTALAVCLPSTSRPDRTFGNLPLVEAAFVRSFPLFFFASWWPLGSPGLRRPVTRRNASSRQHAVSCPSGVHPLVSFSSSIQ